MSALMLSTTGLNAETVATKLESRPCIRKPKQRYYFGPDHQVNATGERVSKKKDQTTTKANGPSLENSTMSKFMRFIATPSKKTKLPAVVI